VPCFRVGKQGRAGRLCPLPLLPPGASVGASDGLSFSQVGGGGLVAQGHGGALKPGGTPEGRSQGGRVTAERRRARVERTEAIDDATVGHAEKMVEIIAQLAVEAGGEQYRCTCGVLGPKVPKLGLREATDVVAVMLKMVKQPAEAATIYPDSGQRGGGWSDCALREGARPMRGYDSQLAFGVVNLGDMAE